MSTGRSRSILESHFQPHPDRPGQSLQIVTRRVPLELEAYACDGITPALRQMQEMYDDRAAEVRFWFLASVRYDLHQKQGAIHSASRRLSPFKSHVTDPKPSGPNRGSPALLIKAIC